METGGGQCSLTGSLMGRMCVRASVADSVALADVIDVVAVQHPPTPADATPERWTRTRPTRRAGQGLSVCLHEKPRLALAVFRVQ